jgi:hypothetical protein
MTPATSGGRFAHAAAVVLALLAAACGGDPSEPGGGTVAFLGLTVTPESGKLYVGQSGSIVAQTFDRDHHLITDVGISWASSDTTVAQVYTYGNGVSVFAAGPGVAVIVASSGQARASASFSVIVEPVASVQVTPASSAAYVGLTTTFTGTALDSIGIPLTGRTVTWSSSNAALATVDAAGQVTARSNGVVTITAKCEGKSASAMVTVVARPTADWSGVTEDWVTYQGNAGHTGYVPATLDPVVFTKLWETAISTSGWGNNQAAVGGGRVFVSTYGYFADQQLAALDAATGAVLWTRDFGAIHSVDPPTYADGTVYVATGGHEDSFLWAFDAATGGERFHTAYENQWSRWQAPVISGGNVYMAGGYYGGMYSFDAAGGERWFNQLGQYDGFTPAVAGGLVYAFTGMVSPSITVTDAATGAVVDSLSDPSLVAMGWTLGATPVLGAAHDVLTAQGNRLLSFDLQGHRLAWQAQGSFGGQPVVANGVVYAMNGLDIEARRESDGSQLWVWHRPNGTQLLYDMIVTRNLLFVSDGATTFAFDLDARLQGWSYPAGGELSLGKDGLLLIARTDGTLTAIKVK